MKVASLMLVIKNKKQCFQLFHFVHSLAVLPIDFFSISFSGMKVFLGLNHPSSENVIVFILITFLTHILHGDLNFVWHYKSNNKEQS